MANNDHNLASLGPSGPRVTDVLQDAKLLAGEDVRASSCCSSAELVQPGDLYFAIDTPGVEGHGLAETAVTRGAVAVIVERMVPLAGVTQYQVPNTRSALAHYCHTLVGNPSRNASVIGIVGNDAPASITRIVAPALARAGRVPAWWDGRWMSDGVGPVRDLGSNVSAPLVASWLSRSVANDASHLCTSIPPSALRSEAFSACCFKTLCLAGGECLPQRGETPAEARLRIAALIDQLSTGGTVVANADDQDCCRAIAESPHRVLTYGLTQPADVRGEVLARHTGGQTLMVRYGLESVAIETSVPGDAHAANCLAAVAIGLACGIDLSVIASGIQSAPRPPGVLEPVVLGQDFTVFLDETKQAQRLRDTAQAIQQSTTGRVVTVVVNQSGVPDPRVLSAAAGRSDLVITTGQPAPGLSGRSEFRFVADSFAAVALGVALAEPGDAVLISGVQINSDGGCPERETVRELIALRNQNTPPAWAA